MLGFIKKDLLIIKTNLKTYILVFLVYSILSVKSDLYITSLLPFINMIIMMSIFSYDTYNNWDAYAITLPNGRKNNIRGRYWTTILLILISMLIVSLLAISINILKKAPLDYEFLLVNMFACIFSTLLMQSILYPIIYKFGLEKARIEYLL